MTEQPTSAGGCPPLEHVAEAFRVAECGAPTVYVAIRAAQLLLAHGWRLPAMLPADNVRAMLTVERRHHQVPCQPRSIAN